MTGALLREATDRIMAAITAELETIRGEQAPLERFDSRKHGLPDDGQLPPQTQGEGDMTTAAVFGTGSWGTAYAAVLADGGTTVRMWGRRQAVVDQINAGSNEDYLPGIALPVGHQRHRRPAEAADGADIVVLAVPSQTLRANLGDWGAVLPSRRRRSSR